MEKEEAIRQVETVLEALYLDKPGASRELVKMIDLLDEIGKKCDKNMQELGFILEKALEAMEYHDLVLLCDVLEYNLLHFLRTECGSGLKN